MPSAPERSFTPGTMSDYLRELGGLGGDETQADPSGTGDVSVIGESSVPLTWTPLSAHVELRDRAVQPPEHRGRYGCAERRGLQIAQMNAPSIPI